MNYSYDDGVVVLSTGALCRSMLLISVYFQSIPDFYLGCWPVGVLWSNERSDDFANREQEQHESIQS